MTGRGLQVVPRGVRGSHPVAAPGFGVGGNTPCVELRCPGRGPLIIDAGTGIIGLGRELVAGAGDDPLEVTLLISHLHWDHLDGFPFFAPLFRAGDTVRVLSRRPVRELEAALETRMSPPHFPAHVNDVPATVEPGRLSEEDGRVGAFEVRPIRLHHPGGCTGFRVRHDRSVFVYASDHEPGDPSCDEPLVDACRDADAVLIDAQYTPRQLEARRGWGHGSWAFAAELAERSGAERVYLFHHDPHHDDDRLEEIVAAARERHPAIRLAIEGEPLELRSASRPKPPENSLGGP